MEKQHLKLATNKPCCVNQTENNVFIYKKRVVKSSFYQRKSKNWLPSDLVKQTFGSVESSLIKTWPNLKSRVFQMQIETQEMHTTLPPLEKNWSSLYSSSFARPKSVILTWRVVWTGNNNEILIHALNSTSNTVIAVTRFIIIKHSTLNKNTKCCTTYFN